MELHSVVFFALQAIACLYAARRGGMPERLTAAAMAVAAIATAVLPFNPLTSYRSTEVGALEIDLLLLAAFVVLMCRADRFWPAWIVALQLLAICIHVIKAADPTIVPIVYSGFVSWIAYPMIALLVIGAHRHRRRSRSARESDWSPLKW